MVTNCLPLLTFSEDAWLCLGWEEIWSGGIDGGDLAS